jgi:hypothetical protein
MEKVMEWVEGLEGALSQSAGGYNWHRASVASPLGLTACMRLCAQCDPAIRLPCPGNGSATAADCRCQFCLAPPLVAYSLASFQSIEGARLPPGPFQFSAGFDFKDGYAGLG